MAVRERRPGLLVATLGATVLGLSVGFLIPSVSRQALGKQQVTNRLVTRQQGRREPFQVSGLMINGIRSVQEGERFDQEGAWLDGLSFKIKNTSEKGITFMLVSMAFPQTRSSGAISIVRFDIGHSLTDQVKRDQPILLAPGESTTFELNAQRATIVRNSLSRRGFQLNDLSEVELQFQWVEFVDKTRWWIGDWYEFDPLNRIWRLRPLQ